MAPKTKGITTIGSSGAGPLCVLYFIALGIAFLIDRRRVARGAEPDWSHLSDDEASPLT